MDKFLSIKFKQEVEAILESGAVEPRQKSKLYDLDVADLIKKAKQYNHLLTQVFIQKQRIDAVERTEINEAGELITKGHLGIDFSNKVFEGQAFRAKLISKAVSILDAADILFEMGEELPEEFRDSWNAIDVEWSFNEDLRAGLKYFIDNAPTQP